MAFPANINLANIDGLGSAFYGAERAKAGYAVSGGDINGDGFDDLIIGAPGAGTGSSTAGATYVVFGKASGFASTTDLASLGASDGFKINGEKYGHGAESVASIGDLNGDGYDDLIIGASKALDTNSYEKGAAYVVFGKASGFAATVELSALNGSNGFKLIGVTSRDLAGWSVASAGDVNNDGYDDVIIGAPWTDQNGKSSGASYVVFGKASGFATNTSLSTLNGANGFKLSGALEGDQAGVRVAAAGDVNGDGYDDVIVGAPYADSTSIAHGYSTGTSYVVFGKASGFPANLELSTLDGSNGFKLSGAAAGDQSGFAVASAGDINGDGFDDLMVAAPGADPHGSTSGASYVVFGKASGFAANVDLSSLNGITGFKLSGEAAGDQSGSIASAGDFNGDGYDDLVIGARAADPNENKSGASYVVFGKASGFAANIDLSTLDGTTGFKLSGRGRYDMSGWSVASAGDVNGDGYDDLIIGAPESPLNGYDSGITYVIYGRADGAIPGTAAAEILTGGKGKDVLRGGGGADEFHGGAADDRIVVGDLAFTLADGGSGTDTLELGNADLTLDLSNPSVAARLQSIEVIDLTGTGRNTLVVNPAALLGGVGSIDGSKHILVVKGNADDSISLSGANWTKAGSYTEAERTFDRYVYGDAEVHLEQGILILGATIVGTDGNDTISTTETVPNQPLATGRNDTIDGRAGADMMAGGNGDDTYVVDDIGDQTIEAAGGGIDTVRSSITHTLRANVENLILTGSAPINGTGNGLANLLVGNAGNNVLDGDAGADTMVGGLGDDTYVLDTVADVVVEEAGGGVDTIRSSVTYTLGANVENLTLTGTSAINGTGNGLDNWLVGNAAVNILAGAGGNDTYVVDTLADIVVENIGQGTDTVRSSLDWTLGANVENLVLTGTGAINGTGNGLANVLTGNAGKNVLNGGAGADTMSGGAGDDTYVVDNAGDVVTEGVDEGTDTVSASVGFALGANIENLILTGAGDINGTGNGLANVLTGNAGKNVLDGGAGADTMTGGAGNDTYLVDNVGDVVVEVSGGGYDTVLSSISWTLGTGVEYLTLTGTANIDGTGNGVGNTLTGNAGNNRLDGGIGADKMAGGLGNDTYVVDNAGDVVTEAAGEGTDTVNASVGFVLGANVENLVLTGTGDINGTGNGLANKLTGNAGKNVLDGGAGADTMTGGADNDSYVVDNVGDVVVEVAGGGYDTVLASISWTLGTGVEYLTLTGTANIDATGNTGGNTLTGNAGNNRLDGGTGADKMAGGLGNDTYVVDNAGDIVTEAAGEGTDTVIASIGWALGANIENLILTGTGDLNGAGNTLKNVLTGNAGKNLLDGGLGADTMTGGAGNDTYVVDNAGDVVVEVAGGGYDTVLASLSWVLGSGVEYLTLTGTANIDGTGNGVGNTLTGNAGNNRLDGGVGTDKMAGGLGDDTYVVDAAGDVVTEGVGEGTDTVEAWLGWTLGANLEQLRLMGTADLNGTGNSLDNALFGNAGKNVLDGGAGADTMTGGAGNDTYLVDNAGDVVVELSGGGGIDTVLSSISHTLSANVEKLVLTGNDAVNGTGNVGNNTLTGNDADNVLDGGTGADTMSGAGGNDTYRVDNAGDVVIELANGGTDTVRASVSHVLSANVENLTLLGQADIDATGNALANTLTGNTGDNILDGGLGADSLSGGSGNDTFRFSTALGPDNVDRLVLFNHNDDTIELDHAIFASLGTGALAAGAFNKGAVATQADDRILYDAASKSLYYDADGLGGTAAVKFATIDAMQGGVLDHTDFLIV